MTNLTKLEYLYLVDGLEDYSIDKLHREFPEIPKDSTEDIDDLIESAVEIEFVEYLGITDVDISKAIVEKAIVFKRNDRYYRLQYIDLNDCWTHEEIWEEFHDSTHMYEWEVFPVKKEVTVYLDEYEMETPRI